MGRSAHKASFACENGVLSIVTPHVEMRIRWQPEPLAEQRMPGNPWQPFIPAFRLLAPADETRDSGDPAVAGKHHALLAFRETIPAAIAGAAEPFRSHQWPLLRLLRASKPACDLVQSNPVLAFAVAVNHEIRMTPQAVADDHAVRHSHQRQRDIAGWLGFPESEAMVRVFRKVPLDLASPVLLRRLRSAAATPEGLRMLGHLPALNTGVVHLLGQHLLAKLITWRLVQEVAANPDEREAAPTGDTLGDAMAMLGDMLAVGTPAPFNSIRQVTGFRETALHEYQLRDRHGPCERLRVRGHGMAWVVLPRLTPPPPRQALRPAAARPARPRYTMDPFPPPPLQGNDAIRPLTTPAELIAEGNAQYNCVGNRVSYEPSIRAGRCYIYRVLTPERATLSIVRRDAHCWAIGELKARGNRAVGPATRRAVRNWLDASQVSL